MTRYIFGNAGGWYHAFKDAKNRTREKIEISKYYDTVNFAKRVKILGIYTFACNGETCPPTSMFAAYNTILAHKKQLLAIETGHTLTNEQTERINKWIENFLKNGKIE